MMLLYIYASIAAAGILALPSYGAWFNANYRFEYGDSGGSLVRVGDEKTYYPLSHNRPMNWWDVDIYGTKKAGYYDDIAYPISLFARIVAWPATLSYYILKHVYLVGSKVLAIPGKKFVALAANKKQADRFLAEGKREVEKLLSAP